MAGVSPDTKLARARAFYAKHGRAWAIIEGAGMEGGDRECGLFVNYSVAAESKALRYEPGEAEALSVAIAKWDAEADGWTYDH